MDGVPPSEAALRRWRRQRRRAAALGTCFGESAMPGTAALGTRELEQGSGGSEADVRWHLVTALRCLADSLEFQGHFGVQGHQGAGMEAADTKLPPWCGQAQHGELQVTGFGDCAVFEHCEEEQLRFAVPTYAEGS